MGRGRERGRERGTVETVRFVFLLVLFHPIPALPVTRSGEIRFVAVSLEIVFRPGNRVPSGSTELLVLLARSLVTAFRSVPFRFVSLQRKRDIAFPTLTYQRVSDDALQPRIKSPRSAASCAGEIRKGISSRVFFDR